MQNNQIPSLAKFTEKAEAGQAKVVAIGSGFYSVIFWQTNQQGITYPMAYQLTQDDLEALEKMYGEELSAIAAIRKEMAPPKKG